MKKQTYSLFLAGRIVAAVLGVFVISTTTGSAAPARVSPAGLYDHSLKTCHVIVMGGTDATVVSSGKSVFLPKGTALTLASSNMHQGYIAVKTKVGGRLVTVSIVADDTDCLD